MRGHLIVLEVKDVTVFTGFSLKPLQPSLATTTANSFNVNPATHNRITF